MGGWEGRAGRMGARAAWSREHNIAAAHLHHLHQPLRLCLIAGLQGGVQAEQRQALGRLVILGKRQALLAAARQRDAQHPAAGHRLLDPPRGHGAAAWLRRLPVMGTQASGVTDQSAPTHKGGEQAAAAAGSGEASRADGAPTSR